MFTCDIVIHGDLLRLLLLKTGYVNYVGTLYTFRVLDVKLAGDHKVCLLPTFIKIRFCF